MQHGEARSSSADLVVYLDDLVVDVAVAEPAHDNRSPRRWWYR
jgi:hypothetical protein